MLEKEGYPFKSKFHSNAVLNYQSGKWNKTVEGYVTGASNWHARSCPKILKYQFRNRWCGVKISDKCCDRLKKDPLHKWQKENNKPFAIIGIMKTEGGRREKANCLAFRGEKLTAFQPLVPVTKEWEDWFIKTYNIDMSDIYKPPYNFVRTGCKGCPFALHLQEELDILEKFFPNERKQCEIIWKPVYNEYRKIGYRLKEPYNHQMTIDEVLKSDEYK